MTKNLSNFSSEKAKFERIFNHLFFLLAFLFFFAFCYNLRKWRRLEMTVMMLSDKNRADQLYKRNYVLTLLTTVYQIT